MLKLKSHIFLLSSVLLTLFGCGNKSSNAIDSVEGCTSEETKHVLNDFDNEMTQLYSKPLEFDRADGKIKLTVNYSLTCGITYEKQHKMVGDTAFIYLNKQENSKSRYKESTYTIINFEFPADDNISYVYWREIK